MTDRERIQLANERMSIIEACRFIGMGDVYGLAKTYCPFGELFHEDGGRGKAFRVYPDTNSAYCFACVRAFRPCQLVATDRDVTEAQAAEIILEEVGYVEPDLDSRWAAASAVGTGVDQNGLVQALKTACARMTPDWEERQLDAPVAAKLHACLAAAEKVETEEQAREWLRVTKLVMSNVLKETL